MKSRAIFLLALLVNVLSTLETQTRNPPHRVASREQDAFNAVKPLEDEMRLAILKGDAGWWAAYLADDFTETDDTGKVTNKTETIEMQQSKTLIYDTLNLGDRSVHTFNGDTAIVNGKMTVKGTYKGQSINGDFQFTRVWVRQGLEWKLASFQLTRIKPKA